MFATYIIVGAMGYIGFTGKFFKQYFINTQNGSTPNLIAQNCLNMFHYRDVPAFILRLAILFLNFSTYPLLSFFVNGMITRVCFGERPVSRWTSSIINFLISFFPLMFALFYPNIGTVLSYAGAVSGFFIIYVLPVFVHLKNERTKIDNCLIVEAISMKHGH